MNHPSALAMRPTTPCGSSQSPFRQVDRIRSGRHTSEIHYYTVVRSLYYCCYRFFHIDLLPTDLARNTIYYLYYMCAYWYPDILVQCNNNDDQSPPACNLLAESSFSQRSFIELISARWILPPSHRNHYRNFNVTMTRPLDSLQCNNLIIRGYTIYVHRTAWTYYYYKHIPFTT